MCFRKNKPARLEKKEPTWFDELKNIMRQPEFWVYLAFIVIFILLIIFAMNEARMYFVYNRGGLF